MLAVLVGRLGGAEPAEELVDLLYALTSIEVFDMLSTPDRDVAAVERLLQTAVDAAIDRMAPRPTP